MFLMDTAGVTRQGLISSAKGASARNKRLRILPERDELAKLVRSLKPDSAQFNTKHLFPGAFVLRINPILLKTPVLGQMQVIEEVMGGNMKVSDPLACS